MKNLYIVSSPFQCISAMEAKTQLGLDENILIAIYYSKDGEKTYEQMREVFKLSHWDEVIEIGLERKKSKYFENLSLIKRLKKDAYNMIFTGHFGQFQNILLSNLKANQIFALDDGAATLRWHKSELNPNLEHPLRLSKKIKMLRYSLLGLKTDFDKKRINYFTMFDLEPYYGETIIQNQFIFMKKFIANKKIDDEIVYFIGQALYDEKIVEKETYLEYLEKAKSHLVTQNKKIIYIPHRREENLKDLNYLVDDNFKIQRLPTSVEIYLLGLDVLPSSIYSFYSTALFSIHKIFGIEATAVYVNSDSIKIYKEGIEDAYSVFKKSGVGILS